MRLLDRYLLRELLVPLIYCLSGFLLLWVSSSLIAELGSLQEKKLLPLDIADYYLVQCPEFLVLGLPIALLLALLYTLTNHARHHELTAIRAAGVSLWRLCLPYFAVGLAASTTVFVLNEFLVPDSSERVEQIKTRRVPPPPNALGKNKVFLNFTNERDGRIWNIPVYDIRTGEMQNPLVSSTRSDGTHVFLKADRAVRVRGVWTFYNARMYKEAAQPNFPPTPLLVTNVLARPEFSETPEQIRSEIKISAAVSTVILRGARKADIPLAGIWNYLRLHPQPSQPALLYTKLQSRLATPLTCLVVVLIAIPFGAASGRRNVFVGVAGSIGICFAYFVVQQLCLALGAGGHVPPWIAGWFPNVAFGSIGLWLTANVR
jgi:LPS export ABC transporter permease LptG